MILIRGIRLLDDIRIIAFCGVAVTQLKMGTCIIFRAPRAIKAGSCPLRLPTTTERNMNTYSFRLARTTVFDSPESAISSTLRGGRVERSRADSRRVQGLRIESIRIGIAEFQIELDDGMFLSFVSVEGSVEWHLESRQSCLSRSFLSIEQEPFLMKESQKIWDPKSIFMTRSNFSIDSIFAGDNYIYVYFARGGALGILAAWNYSLMMGSLYVFELEEIPT